MIWLMVKFFKLQTSTLWLPFVHLPFIFVLTSSGWWESVCCCWWSPHDPKQKRVVG